VVSGRSCWKDSAISPFRSLLHRNYALFWSSDVFASIGQFIREIALFWFVYELTGSAFALGILGLCEAAPRLLLYPFVGVFVDRYDRLRLLIIVQFLIAIPVFILAALYFWGVLQFWHILLLEVIYAAVRSVNPSATQSILRELVPEGELLNAVALLSIGFNMARVVGPSLGGVLILWIGAGGCFLTHAVSLVISASAMLLIQLPRRVLASGGEKFLQEVKDGFRYIWHEPVVLMSIGAAYIISVFVGNYQRFLPVFAKEVLEVGPEGLGVLTAAPGVGAVLSLSTLASAGGKCSG
jgi:predicted MFS family arabinose efflux permease